MFLSFNGKRKDHIIHETAKEVIKVYKYSDLKSLQDRPDIIVDISRLPKNTDKKDIQGLDLYNFQRKIDLRKIFIPYDRESIWIHHKKPRDVFIHLNHTNLKENNVIGNLSPIQGIEKNQNLGTAYFWYNEDTFDEAYKANYPEYFLDENAPQELKEKYYNPKIINIIDLDSEDEKEIAEFLERQTLTFKEYIKYYEFLKGKYLGNFKITKKERAEIAFIDYFGIEKAKLKLEKLKYIHLNLEELMGLLQNTEITKWDNMLNEAAEICRKRNKKQRNHIQ